MPPVSPAARPRVLRGMGAMGQMCRRLRTPATPAAQSAEVPAKIMRLLFCITISAA